MSKDRYVVIDNEDDAWIYDAAGESNVFPTIAKARSDIASEPAHAKYEPRVYRLVPVGDHETDPARFDVTLGDFVWDSEADCQVGSDGWPVHAAKLAAVLNAAHERGEL